MEIAFSTTMDKKTVKAFYRVCLYARNPKKSMVIYTACLSVLAAIDLWQAYTYGWPTRQIVLSVIMALAAISQPFLYYVLPEIKFRAYAKRQTPTIHFVFGDEEVQVFAETSDFEDKAKIKYAMIDRVKETKDYFYIYMSKRQAFVVDKATAVGGTAEEVRNKLMSCLENKRYKILKY